MLENDLSSLKTRKEEETNRFFSTISKCSLVHYFALFLTNQGFRLQPSHIHFPDMLIW